MRIAIAGTQNTGKSTFIDDFIKEWPMYKKASKSYREVAKERNIKLNQQGDLQGQRLIQQILVEQVEANKNEEYVIFDRGPLDNLVYSMWHFAKNPSQDLDLLIEQSIAKLKKIIHIYDIIFFIPLSKKFPVEIVPDNQRDIDPVYREEIDNIFKALIKTYYEGKDTFFPKEDCPAIIEIFGSQSDRINLAKLYVNKSGDAYSDDDSLISDIDDEDMKDINEFKQNMKLL